MPCLTHKLTVLVLATASALELPRLPGVGKPSTATVSGQSPVDGLKIAVLGAVDVARANVRRPASEIFF